ncbi:MAG: zf-TFIIB domain-containing protein [Candidatus Eremiobacterota bacterium]
MSKIACPACRKIALRPFQDPGTGLEIDACPECQGLWFDGGELRQFFQSKALQTRFFLEDHVEPLQTVGYTISTRARACPRCRTGMKENLVGDINVDRCEKCNGIWLDHGELKRIVYKYKQNKGLRGDEGVVKEIQVGLEGERGSALGSFLGALKGLFGK